MRHFVLINGNLEIFRIRIENHYENRFIENKMFDMFRTNEPDLIKIM